MQNRAQMRCKEKQGKKKEETPNRTGLCTGHGIVKQR